MITFNADSIPKVMTKALNHLRINLDCHRAVDAGGDTSLFPADMVNECIMYRAEYLERLIFVYGEDAAIEFYRNLGHDKDTIDNNVKIEYTTCVWGYPPGG